MTNKDAIKIIQMERDHCALHNQDAGKDEEYHKEMQSLVDAFDLAIKALEERPQGEWIFEEDIITFPGNHLKCSNCGFFAEPLNDGNLLLSSFCPYCGAKMKDWYPKRGKEE